MIFEQGYCTQTTMFKKANGTIKMRQSKRPKFANTLFHLNFVVFVLQIFSLFYGLAFARQFFSELSGNKHIAEV